MNAHSLNAKALKERRERNFARDYGLQYAYFCFRLAEEIKAVGREYGRVLRSRKGGSGSTSNSQGPGNFGSFNANGSSSTSFGRSGPGAAGFGGSGPGGFSGFSNPLIAAAAAQSQSQNCVQDHHSSNLNVTKTASDKTQQTNGAKHTFSSKFPPDCFDEFNPYNQNSATRCTTETQGTGYLQAFLSCAPALLVFSGKRRFTKFVDTGLASQSATATVQNHSNLQRNLNILGVGGRVSGYGTGLNSVINTRGINTPNVSRARKRISNSQLGSGHPGHRGNNLNYKTSYSTSPAHRERVDRGSVGNFAHAVATGLKRELKEQGVISDRRSSDQNDLNLGHGASGMGGTIGNNTQPALSLSLSPKKSAVNNTSPMKNSTVTQAIGVSVDSFGVVPEFNFTPGGFNTGQNGGQGPHGVKPLLPNSNTLGAGSGVKAAGTTGAKMNPGETALSNLESTLEKISQMSDENTDPAIATAVALATASDNLFNTDLRNLSLKQQEATSLLTQDKFHRLYSIDQQFSSSGLFVSETAHSPCIFLTNGSLESKEFFQSQFLPFEFFALAEETGKNSVAVFSLGAPVAPAAASASMSSSSAKSSLWDRDPVGLGQLQFYTSQELTLLESGGTVRGAGGGRLIRPKTLTLKVNLVQIQTISVRKLQQQTQTQSQQQLPNSRTQPDQGLVKFRPRRVTPQPGLQPYWGVQLQQSGTTPA